MTRPHRRLDLPDILAALPDALGSLSLPAQIHEVLEEAVIEGGLRPGQRLRADDLAARYGVSRIPVREALRSLEASGWVEIRPRYGVYVKRRTDGELTDLFEVRAVLEAQAAGLAAQRRTDPELAELTDAVKASRAAVKRGSDAQLTRLGTEFYAILRKAAHNAVLAATLATLSKRARFYFAPVAHDLGRGWVHVHEDLVAAIAAQDSARASAIAREHIEHTSRAVHELLVAQDIAAAH